MRNFADFEIINGNYDEARRLLEHALTIREKAFGTEHRDLSVILQGLGDLERINGNYTQAQALYERAMRIEEKITGSSYDRFYILDGMARIHLARNEFPDARLLFGRAIETLTKERGENNPSIAFHKACHHALLDERDQAIHFLRRAIELGFIMPHQITQASDLASLHADPEFEAIVAEAKKRFTEE